MNLPNKLDAFSRSLSISIFRILFQSQAPYFEGYGNLYRSCNFYCGKYYGFS